MTQDRSEREQPLRDDPLMGRVRETLERDSALHPKETARLAVARRRAFAQRHAASRRMPAYGLAVAASVMLVAGLLLLRPDGLEPLPAQLAQLDDLELLLVLEEADAGADPEFLAWALEERG
jgi:hypothetical protein